MKIGIDKAREWITCSFTEKEFRELLNLPKEHSLVNVYVLVNKVEIKMVKDI